MMWNRSIAARAGAFLAGLMITLSLVSQAAAEDYHLDAQDRVRIKVVDWQAGEKQLYEWVELTGDYSVGADGTVALPLIGGVPARGKTPQELANAISTSLRQRTNSLSQPETSVEVVGFRPVYILGDVDKPGEYSYRPGLTVLQAVSIAGGFYRMAAAGMRLDRDRVNADGDLANASLEMRRMLARKARLDAERLGTTAITMPDALKGSPDAVSLIAAEHDIMTARSDQLAAQLASIEKLKVLYASEIASLEEKKVAEQAQLDNVTKEFKNISGLVNQGLALSSRQFALQSNVSDSQAAMVDITTQRIRAQQELSKAEREGIDLRQARRTDIEASQRDTAATIELDAAKIATARGLLAEADATARTDSAMQNGPPPSYTLIRMVDGRSTRQEADEGSSVEPGDVVRVTSPLPSLDGANTIKTQ